MKKALFVDRDGVLNKMVHYSHGWDSPQKPEDVQLVTGIADVISWANKRNILVIEISNQPGVAKAKMTQEIADAIESRVHELLREQNALIDATYICPHHPDAKVESLRLHCDCRKPKAGLFFKVSKDLDIYLSGSIFIGDKNTDVEAGRTAGTKTILFFHTDDEIEKIEALKTCAPDYQIVDMNESLPILRSHFT